MEKPRKLTVCALGTSAFALQRGEEQALSPLRRPVIVPTRALAEGMAREWESLSGKTRKEALPLTRIAMIAIDVLADNEQQDANTRQLLAYAETDLVCYRAGGNPELLSEQAMALDPVLAWAEARFAIALNVTEAIAPVKQPEQNRRKLAAALSAYTLWMQAALTAAVGPLGSLVLALALVERRLDAQAAFHLSHLEEAHETKKWGRDDEKEAKMQAIRQEIEAVERFVEALAKG